MESHKRHQDATDNVANHHHSVYGLLTDTSEVTQYTFFALLKFSVRHCLYTMILFFFLLLLLLLLSCLHHINMRHNETVSVCADSRR
jgi:hypothetical protein